VTTFLAWMQASALGSVMRESGLWTYAIVNLAHVVGVATLFGSALVLDLRLVGCWRRVPMAAVTSIAVPVAGAGFALAALSGSGLLAANALDYAGNPLLLVKFPAIAVALVNVVAVRRLGAWQAIGSRELSGREQQQLQAAGAVSLVCWSVALTAGRLIAYW
jgi:hypothetical protein